jgi:hypothetical protein
MPLSLRVHEGGIGHSVGSYGTRRDAGQAGTRGAARAFARDLDRRIATGRGLGGKRGCVQDGIWEAPVNQGKGK